MTLTYKQSGVNIKKADEFVAGIKGFTAKSALSGITAFGSLFDLAEYTRGMDHPVLVSSTDGVGTKLKIAQDLKVHHTVGIDLVGMNVNDVLCLGARPLFFLDYIACGRVDVKMLSEVVAGINRGLVEADCRLLGGETAEMPGMYKSDEYDLAGFCVGVVDRAKIIDGRTIEAGDCVVGLASNGLHSNGFSLVRRALGASGIKKYGVELLKPTRIYVKPVLELIKQVSVKGIAHITGGSFYNKAVKILPSGLGMAIENNSWPVPEIFAIVQKRARIRAREMYTVLNMGIGMMVVVAKGDLPKTLSTLTAVGERAYLIGKVEKHSARMRFVAKGGRA